jgi:hypothetical protein
MRGEEVIHRLGFVGSRRVGVLGGRIAAGPRVAHPLHHPVLAELVVLTGAVGTEPFSLPSSDKSAATCWARTTWSALAGGTVVSWSPSVTRNGTGRA